jgi:NTP pyrophosphatase (non-canonical NTP hydrolase)
MEVKDAQERVKSFDEERGWQHSWDIKDLLLNITEEGGEMWNLIKWIDDEKQKQVVEENKAEIIDYVGDTLYLILKIANQTGVDVEEAFNLSMEDFEKRFPQDKIKQVKHGNKLAGGWDKK